MFTGIVYEIGELKDLVKISSNLYRITVNCSKVLKNVILGESIAVNGVCLSVVKYGPDFFMADIMQETINKTNFKDLKIKKLNLEKSLKLNSRLDGHFVTGHIDCVAKIKSLVAKEGNYVFGLQPEEEFIKNIVFKGSVAVNGVSLTVSNVKKDIFYVSLIPVTLEETNLKYCKINDILNIETDILGKYVLNQLKFLNSNVKKSITKEFLLNNF